MREWISVQDALPEEDGDIYLVYVPYSPDTFHGVFVALWCLKEFSDFPPNCGCTGFGKVTHWMPLPDPPLCGDKKREPDGFFEGIPDECNE